MSDNHSPSKQEKESVPPLRIIKMEGKKPIVMPKKSSLPQTLSTQLNESEKKEFSDAIREYKQFLKNQVDEQYPDDYNKTTLMDDNITKMKNEILRKIKFYKKKELKLPEFKRTERERILARRQQHVQEIEEQQPSPDTSKKAQKTPKDKKNGKQAGVADSQSHMSQKGGGIKSRGTQQESNATLAQVSEGEDLGSAASIVTGSRKALNINLKDHNKPDSTAGGANSARN